MDQLSFATLDYAAKKKRTKRDVFLAEMAAVVPWVALEAVIEPHYPKAGPNGGRRPFPLAVMLRIYCLQQVQPLRSRHGRSALRHLLDARVRRSGARTRRNSRRDDHLELPASLGAPRVDEGGIRRCFGASGSPRCAAAWRHHPSRSVRASDLSDPDLLDLDADSDSDDRTLDMAKADNR